MFGYVQPAYAELRVREHELYKAYYCGLCRAMGRTTGQLSRFSLNYDLVFLAMMSVRGRRDETFPPPVPRSSAEEAPVRRDERRAFVCLIRIGDTHGGQDPRRYRGRTRRRARGGKA